MKSQFYRFPSDLPQFTRFSNSDSPFKNFPEPGFSLLSFYRTSLKIEASLNYPKEEVKHLIFIILNQNVF
jgi:hypothetical protein